MKFLKDSSKVVFLLGAGASYGSEQPAIVPLGNKLFDELTLYSPHTWGQLPSSLSSIFKKDFEEGMIKTPPQQYADLYIEMAAYFFAKQINTKNLYIELAKRVKKTRLWRGSFVTLNYECLLEQAFSSQRLKLSLNTSDIDLDWNCTCYEILKPHGACNLYNSSLKGSCGMVSMDALGIQTLGEVLKAETESEFILHIKHNAFPPVMSYFQPDKATTSGINFINAHRFRYAEAIAQADKVIIIGVLPRNDDIHIWEPLSITNAQILYCSGIDGVDRYKNWSARFPKRASDIVLNLFFKEGFDIICDFAELER